jgi:hypothetical protein
MQLMGGTALSTVVVCATVTVAQDGYPLTVVLNSAVSSVMQAAYWATVAVHEEGIAPLKQFKMGGFVKADTM